MRVLLLNPPRSPFNGILAHAPEAARPFIHRKLVGPPLGLVTVAAAAAPDHDVTVLDMKGEYDLDPGAPPPRELVRAWVRRARPDVAGATFIASELAGGLEALRAVKEEDPRVVTVAGGLHATLCPRDLDDPAVDVVCPGHAAGIFRELVRAIERGAPPASVKGVFVRGAQGGLAWTGAREGRWDPAREDFILPARGLLARWTPAYFVGRSPGPVTYLFTSLGCPQRCSFCSIWPQMGGEFLERDVESIVAELATLGDYPTVRLADANTVVDAARAGRLFDRIVEEGLQKTFVMDMRVDTAARNPALVEKLARGGLKAVICGFESFRDEELGAYGKGTRARDIEEAIAVFHANGVAVRGNYVVPPDYGEEDLAALAEYASAHRVSYAGYTILTPMPGTELHRGLEGSIADRDLRKYNFFNAVLPTRLPLETFYERVGALWLIKHGTDVI